MTKRAIRRNLRHPMAVQVYASVLLFVAYVGFMTALAVGIILTNS